MKPQTALQKWFFICGYLLCILGGVFFLSLGLKPEAASLAQIMGYGAVILGVFGITWFTFTGEFPYADH